jgi:farnesyl-diphosphate farnesyltransferase
MGEFENTSDARAEKTLSPITPGDKERLLTNLLRGVSRSFYLTLRVLPERLREPIGLAYLLARAADTIADTRILPPEDRLKYLLAFRTQVDGPASTHPLEEISLALRDKQSLPDEKVLLSSLPEAFALLEATQEQDRSQIRSIVITLTRGMENDLTTFPPEDSGRICALKSPAELDQHIYYAAGCVGEFWTAMTMAHTPALRTWNSQRMSEIGVRFGKALQLTNVLRDVAKDLRIGRCYLPESELAEKGIKPQELLEPSVGPKARPVLVNWIQIALDHYRAAEEYLLAIPRRCVRLRLGALWPVLIGLATLRELARNKNWMDPTNTSKVSRKWIYRMMAFSIPASFSNNVLRVWSRRLRKGVEESL